MTRPPSSQLALPALAISSPGRVLGLVRRLVRTYPYLVTCAIVTVVFLGVAVATSRHIGIPIRDPEGALLGRRMVSPILLMGVFAGLDSFVRAVQLKRGGMEGTVRSLTLRTFHRRWWWKRLVLATSGFMCFAFTYLAYRNLKSFLPLVSYRTYDPELLVLDRWMFGGNDPATVLHDVLGTGIVAYALSWIYLLYIPLVAASVSAALVFSSRMREGFVYVAASMWCWILGTISYYAIPTLGPFGGAPRLFEDLPYTNVTRLQDALVDHRIQLYSDPVGYEGVAGIAGFASLHVGVVFMAMLMMAYYRQRLLYWLSFAFLVPTVLATIYFGWHFIIDDIAGMLIGWLAVVLARITVYPRILVTWRRRTDRFVDEHVRSD